MTLTRDWQDARDAKAHHCCRVCSGTPIELAHTIGRAEDVRTSRTRRYVHPDSVVPLCGRFSARNCHGRFDAHTLDLWPFLTPVERRWAVERVGKGEAMRRISGRKWLEAA